MNNSRVLVIDDAADIRSLLRELLERLGYLVNEASDGKAGLRTLYSSPPALVILDVTMPVMDGWKTLERIRELSDVPVLMLTARDTELERVRGLKEGADDYLAKPFGRQELVARVEALLRRASAGRTEVPETYADELISINYPERRVVVAGHDVSLTPLEFKLLSAFVRHPNHVLSSDQLLELVWGGTYGTSRDQVKLYVSYLRRKLTEASPDVMPIETVARCGYRYRPKSASPTAG